ncbi:hypothetical protein BGZ82_003263, partial [Podila clonocystis]
MSSLTFDLNIDPDGLNIDSDDLNFDSDDLNFDSDDLNFDSDDTNGDSQHTVSYTIHGGYFFPSKYEVEAKLEDTIDQVIEKVIKKAERQGYDLMDLEGFTVKLVFKDTAAGCEETFFGITKIKDIPYPYEMAVIRLEP